MKLHRIAIPLIALAVIVGGHLVTGRELAWYDTLRLPSWTPPGSIMSGVWTTLFILTTASALLIWSAEKTPRHSGIAAAFLLNCLLNVGWSYIFFGRHATGPAIIVSAALFLSVIALIILTRPVSPFASRLLIPYAAWTAFATYLTYAVWRLN